MQFQGRGVRPIVFFEIKKGVSIHLATLNDKDLAQTVVEGYYLLMGSQQGIDNIVVALTDVAVTHYFKLKLPATRDKKEPRRELDVAWHHTVALGSYPPTSMEELIGFVNTLHCILNECM